MITLVISIVLSLSVVVTSVILKIALNRVFVIGNLYMIRRDNGKPSDRLIAKGFMHEISAPWRKGKGLQVRIKSQVFQIGFCRKHPHHKEDEGVLAAMGGRYMDVTAKDIREW